MNEFTTKFIAAIMALITFIPIFGLMAFATYDIEPMDSSQELWNNLSEYQQSSDLYDFLSEKGWITYEITFPEFDYILCMVDQLCGMNQNVRPELVLAMIAQESRFNPRANSKGGACGLMQVLSSIFMSRVEPFVEEGREITVDDMYDIRLNLAVGIDYISYILEETGGNEEYALMWYNQGAVSASIMYLDELKVSNYASTTLRLAEKIKTYLTNGRDTNV